MHLDDNLRQLREQLGASASLGDERTQQIAATLASTLEPAVRLAIMSSLNAAADEITAALLESPGAPRAAIRLDGDEVLFELIATEAQAASSTPTDDGEASARISLRLTEALKAQIDDAATRDGVSVNTWLVRAANAALSGGSGWPGHGWQPPTGWGGPWGGAGGGSGGGQRGHRPNRITGWIDG
jgi:hypothetical protein